MKVSCLLALGVSLYSAPVLAQGGLTPPGPPAPAMKTLDQIEPRTPIGSVPFVISRSGSYYCTRDLTNNANENAITINAVDVTLDLGGFCLSSAGGNTSGISVTPQASNVKICNGSIRNFGKQAVAAQSLSGGIVRDIRAVHNGSGILLGSAAVVEQCTAVSNISYGLTAGAGSHIRGLNVIANGPVGINAGDGSILVDCVSSHHTDGFLAQNSSLVNCAAYTNLTRGFNASQGAQFVNCVAIGNGIIGFSGNGEISILKCTARGNGDCGVALFKVFGQETTSIIRDSLMVNNVNYGLLAQAQATVFNSSADFNRAGGMLFTEPGSVTGCTVVSNRFFGISLPANSLVQDCTATRNGTTGILTDSGARVTGCHASFNGLDGISVRAGSTVSGCTARGNGEDGIEVTEDCMVTENNSSGNGTNSATAGGGIHGTLSGNRIEGNHSVSNDNGYRLDGDGNTLFRNTARANGTNWVIAVGNDVGPIGAAATATSPFANIQF